jgi:hypothetical protein
MESNKTGGPDNRTYFLKFSIYPGHLILRVFFSFFNSIIFINFCKTFLEILIFFSLFILNERHYSTLKGLRDLKCKSHDVNRCETIIILPP